MSEDDKDSIQRQLLKTLNDRSRRAFRGPLALRLSIETTANTPAHLHTIAKNLLDLFGRPRAALRTDRRGLLYSDDSQVHGLSVICHHGMATPHIMAEAIPFGALIEDLRVIVGASAALDEGEDNHFSKFDTPADRFVKVKRDADLRNRMGHDAFETWLRTLQMEAQEHLLGRMALKPRDLAYLYRTHGDGGAEVWEVLFAATPLRITLSELPQVAGASDLWKKEIDDKLRAFRTQHGRTFNPLLVPVALEVVIKPPPPSRQHGLHDLDNVLRRNLIPRVVEIFNPASHYAFAFDALARKSDETEPAFSPTAAPPVSSRTA
jgi:hypothetical protein